MLWRSKRLLNIKHQQQPLEQLKMLYWKLNQQSILNLKIWRRRKGSWYVIFGLFLCSVFWMQRRSLFFIIILPSQELLDNKVQTLEKEWSVVEEESLKKPTPGTLYFSTCQCFHWLHVGFPMLILFFFWQNVIVKGPKVPMRIMPFIFVLRVNEKRRQTMSNIT